ncbi:Outer membrane protein SusF domain-containing protein [Segatella copri]|uniref:Outer membrane protein SusF domain-containing protein n=1 Tax=Segatella copri TaxID=165179 RepID=UPI001C439094|nr:DUF5115 domain-containing protein [Segatella copri]MBW0024060.1 DUF5115 domain-containing protein [Segatella copri]
MKKLSLYISIALAGLFMGSCSEDFKDWADPQTNPQEDAITIPGYQASAVSALDLAKVAEDSVNVYTISSATLPEGFELGNSRIELTPEGVENATATEVKTSNDGKAAKADLQALIESVYGKAPVARTFDGHVYTTAVKDGQAALIDAGTVKVTATPVAPNISQNYYIIGGTLDWTADAAKTQKFNHSDINVYDDPIFTITIPAKEGDDTWFGIVDDAACEGVANGDWSSVLGTAKGKGNNALNETEQLDTRAKVGNDASFKVPKSAGAKYIKVEINMLEYTYKITPLSFGEYFYEIGGDSNWKSTNALYGGNGDGKYQGFYYLNGEFKFKPQAGTADWAGDYEFDGEGKIADNGNGKNCPDPGAGFYKIDVDLQAGTYALTQIKSITVVGNHNKWTVDDAKCHMTYNAKAGCWELTTTLQDGFKFAMNDDWAISWGGANGDATAYDNLSVKDGKDLNVPAGEGTYKIQLYLSHEGANKVVLTKK